MDFDTKRDIIRALVKRVEIWKDEIVVVFKVDPDPDLGSADPPGPSATGHMPKGKSMQYRPGRKGAARTQAARNFLDDLPIGPPVILVTHQMNITGLTGQFTAPGSGVLARVPVPGDGDLELLGVLR
jgi:hypothetical protein